MIVWIQCYIHTFRWTCFWYSIFSNFLIPNVLIANVLISHFQAFDFEFRFFHNHVTEKWRLYTFQPLLTTFLISLQILTQPVNSGLSFNIARKSDFVEYFWPFASFEKVPLYFNWQSTLNIKPYDWAIDLSFKHC